MPVTAKDLEQVLNAYAKLTIPKTKAQEAMAKTAQAAKAEGDRIKAEKALLGR